MAVFTPFYGIDTPSLATHSLVLLFHPGCHLSRLISVYEWVEESVSQFSDVGKPPEN